MLKVFAVATGKLLRYLLRLVRRGGGSALPGLVASKIYPDLLRDSLANLHKGVVVISGSAGKSSTTFFLVRILQAHGLKVFTNPSTANIRQGLFAAVLKEASLGGKLDYDVAVLELDEGHGAALSKEFPIRMAVLTNVLSDQLDRFVDPELVAEKLRSLAMDSETLVVNVDDKNLCQFAIGHNSVIGYGLAEGDHEGWRKPSYALNFGEHPQIAKSVAVKSGASLSISSDKESFETAQDSVALALNLAAAFTASRALVTLEHDLVARILASESGVFARNELAEINGRAVNLRLVQNPTSFQLNLSELNGQESPLMLMAGRDIHDPSWLWTVDFSALKKVDIVAGFNAAELALRLKVAGCEIGEVIPAIAASSDRFFTLPGDKPTILFSADAMRRFRRYTKVAK
jgi:UDP-N-acetylmuramoylalanine-D-glutamate ligase